MKRLFTFGCSFTEYGWPTWADLLGAGFDLHENWGLRGIGNRAIAERIAECCTKNKFTKDDTVIVQWSGHLRHDWYHIHNFPDGRHSGWKTSGSIFSPNNSKIYTDSWIELFFYEPAYIMHTLNSIVLSKRLIESTGATYFMTSIGDIRNLGSDIDTDIKFGEYLPRKFEEKFSIFKDYEDELWNNDLWVEPLKKFSTKYKNLNYKFLDERGSFWEENHLSTVQYSLWIFEKLAEKVIISDEVRNQINVIVDSVENIKKTSAGTLSKFSEDLMASKDLGYIRWPNLTKGY